MLEVGAPPDGSRALRVRVFPVFFGERSPLHGGERSELDKERMALRSEVVV